MYMYVHVNVVTCVHVYMYSTCTMKGTKVQILGEPQGEEPRGGVPTSSSILIYVCALLIDGLGHTTRSAIYMYLSLASCI